MLLHLLENEKMKNSYYLGRYLLPRCVCVTVDESLTGRQRIEKKF